MRVEQLTLRGFRNYEEAAVRFDDGINVLSGENAQGKTNMLEAVYMLSGGRSFRTRFDKEIIGFDQNYAEISAIVFSQERSHNISLLLQRGQKKQIIQNKVKVPASELSRVVKTVLFCPDDLNLIRDGASERRKLMDLAICQLRPGYAKLLSDYNRLYENKMRILRDYRENKSMLDTLEDFSDGLARISAKIIRYRSSFIQKLSVVAAPIHREFSGSNEELLLKYNTVSTVTDPMAGETIIYNQILDHQHKHASAELASGTCLTGVHKDDIDIFINGRSARNFASQGQTRTAALSIKMAERDIFLSDTGDSPILLLDDVLSELDSKRQEFVLNRIKGGQTLITCCEDEHIVRKTGGRVVFIHAGNIRNS